MRVITLTSDRYIHALKPFSWLFNKYWSADQEVLVAGFTPPSFKLPSNFEFLSIGKFSDYPVGKWSNALINLLETIDDEAFVLMLEDYWLTRAVNIDAVGKCYHYCRQFGYVLRIDLTTDRLFAHGPRYPGDIADYGQCGYIDLIRSEPGSQYHMSLMTAVWRRDNLLKVLIPNETPWEVELTGTHRLSSQHGHDLLVLGTRQWPIRHTLGYRSGDPTNVRVDGMLPEDVQALRELGYL